MRARGIDYQYMPNLGPRAYIIPDISRSRGAYSASVQRGVQILNCRVSGIRFISDIRNSEVVLTYIIHMIMLHAESVQVANYRISGVGFMPDLRHSVIQ